MKQKYYLAVITYVKTLLLSKLRNNQFNAELVTFIRTIPDEQLHKFKLENMEFISLVKQKYRTHSNYFANLINVLFYSLDGNFMVSYNYIHCDYIIEELYELYSTSDFKKACCHYKNIIDSVYEENSDWLCNILNDLDHLSNFTSEETNKLGQIAIAQYKTPPILKNVGIRYYLSHDYKKSSKYLNDYLGKAEQLEIKSEEVVLDYLLHAETLLKLNNTAMALVNIRKARELADEINLHDYEASNYAYKLSIKAYKNKLCGFKCNREEFIKQFNLVKKKLNHIIDWDNASDEVFDEFNAFEKIVPEQKNSI